MQKTSSYKCPECSKKYINLNGWINHLGEKHSEIKPENMTYGQFFYFLQTKKVKGSCIICKKDTEWNENTMKYSRFCTNPACKQKYRDQFKNRMMDKYGRTHLLDDAAQQRKMLANKKMSGTYTFKDGSKIKYVGSYEKDFISMLDLFLHFPGSDILGPSPHTYMYHYDNPEDPQYTGVERMYIPDYYISSLNLEIEIKQSDNTHPKLLAIDKVKEKQKDEMMRKLPTVNYMKITDKNYSNFFDLLMDIKLNGTTDALDMV